MFPAMDDWNRTALSVVGGYAEGSAARRKDGQGNEQGTPEQWLGVLDDAGIESTVLYPTRGLGFGRVREVDWSITLAKAYNSWLPSGSCRPARASTAWRCCRCWTPRRPRRSCGAR